MCIAYVLVLSAVFNNIYNKKLQIFFFIGNIGNIGNIILNSRGLKIAFIVLIATIRCYHTVLPLESNQDR